VRHIESPFLDAVRSHPAVTVIEVTAANREEVYREVAGFWG